MGNMGPREETFLRVFEGEERAPGLARHLAEKRFDGLAGDQTGGKKKGEARTPFSGGTLTDEGPARRKRETSPCLGGGERNKTALYYVKGAPPYLKRGKKH